MNETYVGLLVLGIIPIFIGIGILVHLFKKG